ncbi:hypothetical protein HDU77_007411 [Chytriomyces hyalinus]|nr:hypothetical protein HDU77_007411 [Chytriomyces hyalinus]
MTTQISAQIQCGVTFCLLNGQRFESGQAGILCDGITGCSFNCEPVRNTLQGAENSRGLAIERNAGCTVFSASGIRLSGNNGGEVRRVEENGREGERKEGSGERKEGATTERKTSEGKENERPRTNGNTELNRSGEVGNTENNNNRLPEGTNPNGVNGASSIVCNGVNQCSINGVVVPSGQQGVVCENGVCLVNGVQAQSCQGQQGSMAGLSLCSQLMLASNAAPSFARVYGVSIVGIACALVTGF